MKTQLNSSLASLLLAAAVTLPNSLQAQPVVAAHYPAGAEGIKGASLPPPGLYFRDYNFFYSADRFNDGPPNFKMVAYVNAPRLIWMTDLQILGANYGMDVIVPFGYMNYRLPNGWNEYSGLGDVEFEPLLLSWHLTQFDFSAGYAVWAPTGHFSTSRPDMFIQGFWSHMLTLGGTWYADKEKTWAFSLLNRYEICHQQQDTEINPGQVYTLEWGFSKALNKTTDVGLIGYYQQQTTEDTGARKASDKLDSKVGIGPEVSVVWPDLGLITSLRYAYEFGARERPEGHLVSLTLTKRF